VDNNSWFSPTTKERENCIHWPFCCIGQTADSQRTSPASPRHKEMNHCAMTDKPGAGNNNEQLYHETSEIISSFLTMHCPLEHLFLLCNFAKCKASHSQRRGRHSYSEGTGWAQTPGKSVKQSVKTAIHDKQLRYCCAD
jgi:hypothetical protein